MTVDEPVLTAKISRRLIPFMFVLYIVSYLDRINVGFAALQLNGAMGFDAAIYGIGAGIFFIGYFCFEIPSNLIMQRVGARRWIARILVTWGLISSAMMCVQGVRSFYALRFLLGVAEAGFFPGMILYLTYWFPPETRARAVATFMTATAIAGVIGGPVSGALLQLDGWHGLAGWQWLFLVEGVPAVLLGVATFVYLPDGPQDASWLSVDEKAWIAARSAREHAQVQSHGYATLAAALRSGRVWMLSAAYFLVVMSFYGVSLWLPQIIAAFAAMPTWTVGMISAIPYAAAAVAMVVVGRSSDRTGDRRWHVALSAWTGALGLAAAAQLTHPVAELAALSVAAAGIWGLLGPYWAFSSRLLTGAGAAGGIALINSIGNLGGFVGPYLVGWIRGRTTGFAVALWVLAVCPMFAGLITLMVKPLPRK